jgi:curli biogenesis system outer membrane secretion channel CsgG
LQLTAFLATAMATTGKFTVVPREQLRERLMDEKKASYRKCFDSACQIELGKAVSAEKTLATQLLQVGEECAVVANLYDLHSETSSAAAMVQTGCEEKKLMGAMKQVAEQIAAQVK